MQSLSLNQTIEGSHSFTVKGYSLVKGIGIGNHITSDAFTAGGHQWRIHFYPDGISPEDNSMYVSLCVVLDSDVTDDVRAFFELIWVDQSGKGDHVVERHHGLPLPNMWGYEDYFRRDLLEESNFLKDDCLKLCCTVRVEVTTIDPPRIHSIDVPKSDIDSHFGMLLEDEMGSDIVFNVSGKTFRAHRLILAARSPVFEREFLALPWENEDEIEIADTKPLVFKALLHFIYTDSLIDDIDFSLTGSSEWLSLSETLPAKLLCVACKYKLPRLSLLCESVLCKKLTVESVSELLVLADQYNAPDLKLVGLNFAVNNFVAFVGSDGFEFLREHYSSLIDELKAVARTEVEVRTSVWEHPDFE